MKFVNPRNEASVENWPHGSKRVTALFFVETNKKGSRIGRCTTGKPKYTTYHKKMVIVDGDDGKTYAVGSTEYGQIVVWDGTLKTNTYYYPEDEEHSSLSQLLTQ